MSQKPETKFRKKVREKLAIIPKTYFESIQQLGICGTPDLLGCVGPLFVAIEIKTDIGISSALQIYKRKKIAETGSIAMVIAPHNLEASIKFIENISKQCTTNLHDKCNINKKERTDA